ncbi:tRNA uridine 5-carboxymethylaminomethyl modification enzyme MnmG [Gossypium arboreum]|uniref:tRNA uridine 5-carboxymethylaminomethyl modification enzyme MnmG n=1 Tax=Gossypium arboreum TaxID=29729 RepID=A0A0B0N5E6_GOSAR|nr:tRNA uridine 5-carboxymethylaminomethyl modification enzyme MnmG [Gossypium arboreum]
MIKKVSLMNKLNLWVKKLGKIANALKQFTADKTPHLYEEVTSMEVEGFDDDFLCSMFDYLVSHEFKAKAFLVKSKKHRKI